MEVLVSGLVAAVITVVGSLITLYFNRRWQLNQEARAENLDNYRKLKTLGFLQVEGLERLPPELVVGEEGQKRLRDALLEAGTAIYNMDLIASPRVLQRFVSFFREVDAHEKQLEALVADRKKLTRAEFEGLKSDLRKAYVELFLAMRDDLGRSNHKLKREDLEYLLLAQIHQMGEVPQAQQPKKLQDEQGRKDTPH